MNINNVIARAQRLMLDEGFQRDVERAAAAQRGNKVRGGENEFADVEAALFGAPSAPRGTDIYAKTALPESVNYGGNPATYGNVQIVKEVAEPHAVNSKVPAAIRESFEKTPYQGTAFDVTGQYNPVLDSLAGIQPSNSQPTRTQINEQAPVQGYGNGVINYDVIKYIVNEAVREALKGNLNESVNGSPIRGMKLCEGNVLQFLDSKGNLFEAKLTLKKRAAK